MDCIIDNFSVSPCSAQQIDKCIHCVTAFGSILRGSVFYFVSSLYCNVSVGTADECSRYQKKCENGQCISRLKYCGKRLFRFALEFTHQRFLIKHDFSNFVIWLSCRKHLIELLVLLFLSFIKKNRKHFTYFCNLIFLDKRKCDMIPSKWPSFTGLPNLGNLL